MKGQGPTIEATPSAEALPSRLKHSAWPCPRGLCMPKGLFGFAHSCSLIRLSCSRVCTMNNRHEHQALTCDGYMHSLMDIVQNAPIPAEEAKPYHPGKLYTCTPSIMHHRSIIMQSQQCCNFTELAENVGCMWSNLGGREACIRKLVTWAAMLYDSVWKCHGAHPHSATVQQTQLVHVLQHCITHIGFAFMHLDAC